MVFVVNNYKSKNSYIIWILLLFCVRRLKSTLSFCLLNYFHNRTWYFAKIVVCKQVVYSLQYKRSSKQLNATSWTLLVLKLYGLGYICLVLLRPSNFHRHRGGWLPPNQHRHRGVCFTVFLGGLSGCCFMKTAPEYSTEQRAAIVI